MAPLLAGVYWKLAAALLSSNRGSRHIRKLGPAKTSIAGSEMLVRSSRLTARIDNNCIADGFQIYLHSFVLAASGEWAVVQQDMNAASGFARRYHWHSAKVRDFVVTPHTGIMGEPAGPIINLVDAQAGPAQDALLMIARDRPELTLGQIRYLEMPRHHDVRVEDVNLKRLGAVLAVAYERDLHSFADFLLMEKLGHGPCKRSRWSPKSSMGHPYDFQTCAVFLRPWREGRASVSCPTENLR
jgi:hypothetical protein